MLSSSRPIGLNKITTKSEWKFSRRLLSIKAGQHTCVDSSMATRSAYRQRPTGNETKFIAQYVFSVALLLLLLFFSLETWEWWVNLSLRINSNFCVANRKNVTAAASRNKEKKGSFSLLLLFCLEKSGFHRIDFRNETQFQLSLIRFQLSATKPRKDLDRIVRNWIAHFVWLKLILFCPDAKTWPRFVALLNLHCNEIISPFRSSLRRRAIILPPTTGIF